MYFVALGCLVYDLAKSCNVCNGMNNFESDSELLTTIIGYLVTVNFKTMIRFTLIFDYFA